jgi:hypothetical protein
MAHLDIGKVQSNERHEQQQQKNQTELLEYGDIYFFYRPKVRSEQVKGIEDVRRFFMVTAPEQQQTDNHGNDSDDKSNQIYRLFVIGKKSLPTIRKSEARQSERYWARVGGVFNNADELTKELLSDEFRKGDAARPVGEGKYAIIKYHNHSELAYILELPKEPGEAQKELSIEKEASYVISVINPKNTRSHTRGYPSTEEPVHYPSEILGELNDTDNFISLTKDAKLINYKNAQVILIGAREGKDVIKNEIGIEIDVQEEGNKDDQQTQQQFADIFSNLKLRKDKIPIRPLIEGRLE